MKKVKGFNDFTFSPILEKLNVGKYQRSIEKFYKNSGVELHNASTYPSALTVLIELTKKFIETGTYSVEPTIDNATALTIFALSILTPESKDKTEKLYEYLKNEGYDDTDLVSIINQLKNIKEIFSISMYKSGVELETFEDMLQYTAMFVPYITVINILIDDDLLNPNYLSVEFDEFKNLITKVGLKILIMRILHKLNIITKSTNKFQNKDNVKPLKVNDEFKSPMYKSVDVTLEKHDLKKMTTDVKGKIERSKKLSKDMKDKIIPLIINNDIYGTKYNNGLVTNLKIPKISGKSFSGVGLGADKNGFFVMTHRARSKSKPEIEQIPDKDIKFIKSTG